MHLQIMQFSLIKELFQIKKINKKKHTHTLIPASQPAPTLHSHSHLMCNFYLYAMCAHNIDYNRNKTVFRDKWQFMLKKKHINNNGSNDMEPVGEGSMMLTILLSFQFALRHYKLKNISKNRLQCEGVWGYINYLTTLHPYIFCEDIFDLTCSLANACLMLYAISGSQSDNLFFLLYFE